MKKDRLETVLYNLLESIRVATVYLQAYLPDTAEKIFKVLNTDKPKYEDNTFKPDNPITRAKAVKIINSVLDRNDYRNEKNPFTDVKTSHWAYKQILEAAIEHTK